MGSREPDCGWEPSEDFLVERMIELGRPKDGDTWFELGAGDGKVLLAIARRCPGVNCVGYELDEEMFKTASLNIQAAARNEPELKGRIKLHNDNIFEVDLSPATHISYYFPDDMIAKLLVKFQQLRDGVVIISNNYPFEKMQYDELLTLVPRDPNAEYWNYVYRYVTPIMVEKSADGNVDPVESAPERFDPVVALLHDLIRDSIPLGKLTTMVILASTPERSMYPKLKEIAQDLVAKLRSKA